MKKLLLSLTLVLTATTGFAQWTVQNTGFATASRGIAEIQIVDPMTVWARAYDGANTSAIIYDFTRTTNGGSTWTPGTINVSPGLTIANISPVSGTTAWAGAFNATSGLGGVWKTSDAGVTWTQQNASAYTTAGSSWFNFVHFFDEMNGVTQGDPLGTDFEIFYTNNGGTTWIAPNGITLPNPLAEEYGYNGGYAAAGNSLFFTTNKGRIYRTTNMGVTWTVHQSPLTDFGTALVNGKLYVTNDNTGVILGTMNGGSTYELYTSTNLGSATPTWSAGVPYSGGTARNLAYVPNTTTIVAVGSDNTAYSNNNGLTFTTIDSGVQRTAVDFIDPSTGWAGGFNTSSVSGGIFKYTGPALSTNAVNLQKAVSASPNPTSGMLKLVNDSAVINHVAVFDLLGKQVFNSNYTSLNEINVDLSGLQTGAYILKASTDAGAMQTIKIMKN